MKRLIAVICLCAATVFSQQPERVESLMLGTKTHKVQNAIVNFGTGTTADFTGASVVGLTINSAVPTSNTVWVDTSGSDSTGVAGDVAKPVLTISQAITLATALTPSASNPVLIKVGSKIADLGASRITLPPYVSLDGAGMYATEIQSTVDLATGAIVTPGTNSTVSNLTIRGTAGSGVFQAPFGHGDGVRTPFTGVVVSNVQVIADSDGFYINPSSGATTLKAYKCIISTKFDALTLARSGSSAEFYDCVVTVTGPSTTGGGASSRGMYATTGASAKFSGGSITVNGATSSNIGVNVAWPTSSIELIGTRIFTGSSATSNLDLSNAGTLIVTGCKYDSAKTSGTIIIGEPTVAALSPLATFAASPSSANLAALMNDETGTGLFVLNQDASLSGNLTLNLATNAKSFFVALGAGSPKIIEAKRSSISAGALGFFNVTPSSQLASPDLGTLATTFGLASGTPTFGAANLTGTIAQARLGTGSDGSGTHFLADDQTYKTVSSGGVPDDGSVTDAKVSASAAIVQSKLNLNGVIPTGWLGTSSTTAAAGNDSRIVNALQANANQSAWKIYGNGTSVSNAPAFEAATGTGSPVRATSPTFVTPVLGTPASGNATNLTNIPAANITGANALPDGVLSTNVPRLNTLDTFTAGVTVSGSALTLSGNQSAPAWTTNGLRIVGVSGTLTDTTSSGTVATAYTNKLGGNTIAASSATTFATYISSYFSDPVAGSNVTLTNKYALGGDSLRIGTSTQLTINNAGQLSTSNGAVFGSDVTITGNTFLNGSLVIAGDGSISGNLAVIGTISGSGSGITDVPRANLTYDDTAITEAATINLDQGKIYHSTASGTLSHININLSGDSAKPATVLHLTTTSTNAITLDQTAYTSAGAITTITPLSGTHYYEISWDYKDGKWWILGDPELIQTADIADGAVTLAKMANMATSSLIYRKTAGTGAPEVNSLATLKTDLLLTGTNSGDQTITLTGDVAGSGTGSFAATIANVSVTNAKIANSTIDLTTKVTGTLPYGNGGTGATSFTNHGVVTAGASALLTVAPGTNGNVLTSNGTDWTSAAASGVGAPTTATYITETADAGLSAEFALGSLATGILKNTTTTGVPSIAAAGTDYADLAFKTLSVSGQSDVVADTASDTLTLAAGSNVTITTNASTDTITIAASSGGTSNPPSGFVVHKNGTAQNFTTATATKLTWSTESFDLGSEFASDKFTVGSAGYYYIEATAHATAIGTGTTALKLHLYKNGSLYKTLAQLTAVSGLSNITLTGTAFDTFSATDYLEVFIEFTGLTAGTATIAGNANETWFAGDRQAYGSGDFSGASASVDGEVVLFSGTTGKAAKRATGTGVAKLTSGVLGTSTAGVDYVAPGFTCGGRLTTETGVPISSADRTAQSTIYFTPYQSNQIALYTSSVWKRYTFAEVSFTLSSLTSGKNYDVFLYDNSGTLTIELSAAWTNDTTRADALALQDGINVKSSDHSRLHLGTIRTTGTTTTEDSSGGTTTQVGGKRFVWNRYNQIPAPLTVIDTTSTWSYATDTVRQANAASGNKVEFVCGDVTPLNASITVSVYSTGASARYNKAGIGYDSTTAFSGLSAIAATTSGSGASCALAPQYRTRATAGYHYVAWCERGSDGTASWQGANSNGQSGLSATIQN